MRNFLQVRNVTRIGKEVRLTKKKQSTHTIEKEQLMHHLKIFYTLFNIAKKVT